MKGEGFVLLRILNSDSWRTSALQVLGSSLPTYDKQLTHGTVSPPVSVDRTLSQYYSGRMEVQLTPDQEAFVRKAVANGRYPNAEAAVLDAMARWEEGERARLELLAAIDEAEADLGAGHFIDCTDASLPRLADALKREARELRKRP